MTHDGDGDLIDFGLPLVFVWRAGKDVVLVGSTVVQVVCEGGQLHGQDHLRSGEIKDTGQVTDVRCWCECMYWDTEKINNT